MTPNQAIEPTAKQRPCGRCLVPSSLRSSAAVHRERWGLGGLARQNGMMKLFLMEQAG